MPKRILIDATHVEETRVVLLENGRVQEFDSETSVKQQLKGNIYLAKVTRVEPSLQAAFVDYGGDKHGFLPFSEIHPDYYNIPISDKQALLKSIRDEERAEEIKEYDDEDADSADLQVANDEVASVIDASVEQGAAPVEDADVVIEALPHRRGGRNRSRDKGGRNSRRNDDDFAEASVVDVVGGGEDDNDHAIKNSQLYKKYKIQEVIRRNQIILVQVDKEERGNKGASLTSFISLAGRYSVLMPNSLRRGGVSRKIANAEDRRRLKKVVAELRLSEDAGIIVRTAGSTKTDKEIKDDYDYLAGLWNQIRELTLTSTAPAFVHEESSIIKRTMRDMYNDDVKEVMIEGDETYKAVKSFIQRVMPDHSGNIRQYKNKVPIFSRYKAEEQIGALFKAQVSLESGGSIVINPTEALISIDVNSGKSTGQRSVEETATSTNLEAAQEISRQLRLRDLSGLIVIDFIDMMELKNRKAVENVLKNAFADDRAKIQIGRISSFGLLEMSRQRMRASFLEVNTKLCHVCGGSGTVKATESIAVNVLRAIEDEVSRGTKCKAVDIHVSTDVAIYILNNKRRPLSAIEDRYNVRVYIRADSAIVGEQWRIAKIAAPYEADVAEESEGKDENSESAGQVLPFPDRKSRRGRRGAQENANENTKAVSKKPITVGSILGGLWERIID